MSPRYRSALFRLIFAFIFGSHLAAAAAEAEEAAARPAAVNDPVSARTAELAQLVRSAIDREPFHALDHFAADRTELLATFQRLEAYLSRSRLHGAAWRKHLRSDELGAELAKAESADLSHLESILERYRSGHAGLELAYFRDVHGSLADYCRTLRVVRLDDRSAEYRDCLTRLATTLEHKRLRSRSFQEIGASLAWLERHGLADDVVHALRHEYVQPNLVAQLSSAAICSQLDRELDERLSINNMINGAHVTGIGRLQGSVRFTFVPNSESAAIQMQVRGTIDTVTTARSGPVGLGGRGRTQVTGEKLILADGETVHSLPAAVSAETTLRPTSVWSTFRGPLLDRVARRAGWRKNLEQLPSSERTVSRRAERDLRRRIDTEAAELVAALNQTYVEELRVPLSKQGIFPSHLRLSTTRDHLRLGATVVNGGQLAALSPPPQLNHQAIASVAIHESFFNNIADTTLSGRTLQASELAGVLEKLLGEAPFGFDNVDGVPWELTVAEGTPLEIHFAEGSLTVTIGCRKITAGPEMFDVPFAVTARYGAEIVGDAVVFHRQGDLGVAGPALGGIGKLSDGVTDSQAVIAERFKMLFQEELRFTADQLPFQLPGEGKLVPSELEMNDGWLLLSFDRERAKLTREAPLQEEPGHQH